ncbi:flagellar protein FlaG [Vallitalea okinawensis]|uniref:flagellar protein FlaG n=1 Tax=Vallitalea okinawensis TaxID=2078660 RepID=UPI000CFBA3B5|nr:flagellar protein FlaG [Vallitalea okinawensis]
MEINNGVNISSSKNTAQANTNIERKSTLNNVTTSQYLVKQNKEGTTQDGLIPAVEERTVVRAIEEANKKLVGSNKEMRLSIHEETKKINIKIIDKDTDEVIKEYPPEKLLDIFARMIELSGLIVDEMR